MYFELFIVSVYVDLGIIIAYDQLRFGKSIGATYKSNGD